jgi:metal-responsive CopG/Arc/MetJ family transcriptional regulator
MEHNLKHNVSISIDQKLFREIENIRGREKRSTFIEHLIVLGLKDYANTNQKKTVRTTQSVAALLSLTAVALNREHAQS